MVQREAKPCALSTSVLPSTSPATWPEEGNLWKIRAGSKVTEFRVDAERTGVRWAWTGREPQATKTALQKQGHVHYVPQPDQPVTCGHNDLLLTCSLLFTLTVERTSVSETD